MAGKRPGIRRLGGLRKIRAWACVLYLVRGFCLDNLSRYAMEFLAVVFISSCLYSLVAAPQSESLSPKVVRNRPGGPGDTPGGGRHRDGGVVRHSVSHCV